MGEQRQDETPRPEDGSSGSEKNPKQVIVTAAELRARIKRTEYRPFKIPGRAGGRQTFQRAPPSPAELEGRRMEQRRRHVLESVLPQTED